MIIETGGLLLITALYRFSVLLPFRRAISPATSYIKSKQGRKTKKVMIGRPLLKEDIVIFNISIKGSSKIMEDI